MWSFTLLHRLDEAFKDLSCEERWPSINAPLGLISEEYVSDVANEMMVAVAQMGSVEMLNVLLKYEPDVLMTCKTGREASLLMHAVHNGHVAMSKVSGMSMSGPAPTLLNSRLVLCAPHRPQTGKHITCVIPHLPCHSTCPEAWRDYARTSIAYSYMMLANPRGKGTVGAWRGH